MERSIKQKYHFAASSFTRIYGREKVTSEMLAFCYEWALLSEQAPLDCLQNVDCYFKELWSRRF